MNFNPENTQTLQSLLAALGNGLSANTAYPILQQTIAAQNAAVQAKKEQMQGYAGNIMDLAGQGIPQGTATSIMDLLTPKPGLPPRVEQMMQTAYPAPPTNASGAQMDFPSNNPINAQYGTVPNSAAVNQGVPYEQQVSSMYLDNPQAQMDAALQQAQLQQAMQPAAPSESMATTVAMGDIARIFTAGRASGKSDEEIINVILSMPELAGVWAQNASKILLAVGIGSPVA